MALGALECRGKDSILRSTPHRMLLCHFRRGISTPIRKAPPLRRYPYQGGGGHEARRFFSDVITSLLPPPGCLRSSTVGRGVFIFTLQKPPYLSALGDLVSSQIIFGPRGRWTHCTFSGGFIISILETVIYETLAFFRRVFPPSKAKNIVIVCDVLKTLVTSWSQMLINVKCFLKSSAFGSLTGLPWHLPISFKFW